MYLAGYKHNYSDASVSSNTIEQEQSKAKLAFAFSWGKTRIPMSSNSPVYNYAYASQDNRDWFSRFFTDTSGNRLYNLSLYVNHEDGLLNRFWKEYDAFLRHSGYEVNISLKIPEFELSKIKPWQKIMIDNQLYIPEEIRYNMGRSDKLAEFKLRTVRLYEPYDLESEQALAAYTDPKYYWQRVESVKSPETEKYLIQNGFEYDINGYRSDEFDHRDSLILLPPTEEQYAAQETLVLQYRYEVRWRQNDINQSSNITQTITYYPTLIE
jgi:hypothetical protein